MDQIAVGRFITKKRKEKNLTQEQLAEKIGVSNKTISKWETGKCMPDYCIVEILCQELSITLAELINGEEDEKSIHTYDNQNVLELLKEKQQLKNKKLLLIGVIFIIMGIAKLVLSKILGGTGFQAALSGILLGVSVPEILLGIFLICFSIKK
ncbi:MAG: helix-turn-helix domain-containing protein [Lachnospiraceae bacterium]|nr:helix-turn-helix domain-containing protein [Lachnospiraceae bacterium]